MFRWLFNRSWARRGAKSTAGLLESAPFLVRPNKRYRATVTLSFWEATVASNGMIEDQFRELGFKDPTVTGSGTERKGEALWPKPEQSFPIDPHLSNVEEIA